MGRSVAAHTALPAGSALQTEISHLTLDVDIDWNWDSLSVSVGHQLAEMQTVERHITSVSEKPTKLH